MTAAIWSTPPDKLALDFPILTLLRFMYNHHLLQLTGKPAWLTIPGGSHTYVNRILDKAKLPEERQHLSTRVTAVRSLKSEYDSGSERISGGGFKDGAKGVVVRYASSSSNGRGEEEEVFDAVIMATHSDTTLNILESSGDIKGGATDTERDILRSFEWNQSEAVLHCDEEVRPFASVMAFLALEIYLSWRHTG